MQKKYLDPIACTFTLACLTAPGHERFVDDDNKYRPVPCKSPSFTIASKVYLLRKQILSINPGATLRKLMIDELMSHEFAP
jgi:hypothetical protein